MICVTLIVETHPIVISVAPFTVCKKLVPDTEFIGDQPVVVPESAGDVLDLSILNVPDLLITTPLSTHDLKSPIAPDTSEPAILNAKVSD